MRRCPHCGFRAPAQEFVRDVCPDCGRADYAEPVFEGDEPIFESVDSPGDPRPAQRRPAAPVPSHLRPGQRPAFSRAGRQQKPKNSLTMIRLCVFGGLGVLMIALCGGVALWSFIRGENGRVYVDNGTDQTMTVFVDGEEVETVPPKSVRKVTINAGERAIRVEQNGKAVFEGTKTIEGEDYVLNPDETHRYFVRTVKYYYLTPPIQKQRVRLSFEDELASLFSVVTPIKHNGPWFQYPDDWNSDDFELDEQIPYEISEHGSDTRKAMLRMSREDYELLQELRALNGKRPTGDQIRRFVECRTRLLRIPKPKPIGMD